MPPAGTDPGQALLRRLFETYYAGEGALQEGGGDSLVSSYWRLHTPRFDVQMDEEGRVTAIRGIALGDTVWPGRGMRLLDDACILTHLLHLPGRVGILRTFLAARKVCHRMGMDPTLHVFRQACAWALIRRFMPEPGTSRRRQYLMIGDGYGILSSLVRWMDPDSSIFLVDIGRTLFFQAYYCQKAHPGGSHVHVDDLGDDAGPDFVYCPAEKLDLLDGRRFDIAVNISSMQEMNPPTIARYFGFMRRTMPGENLFYCCNRDYKEMDGGDISEFARYPWRGDDRILVDGTCPWYSYFFAVGKFEDEEETKVAGIRIPLVKRFGGILHRLVVLAPEKH